MQTQTHMHAPTHTDVNTTHTKQAFHTLPGNRCKNTRTLALSHKHSLVLVSTGSGWSLGSCTPLGAQWLTRGASSSFLLPSLLWHLLAPSPLLCLQALNQQRLVLCPSSHPRSRGRPCNRGCPGPAPAQFLHPSPPPLRPPCWSRPGASSARPPPH